MYVGGVRENGIPREKTVFSQLSLASSKELTYKKWGINVCGRGFP